MLSLRRSELEPRIEMMPMIDVIFLLLTFFIYALVLMAPQVMLPLKMQAFGSGKPLAPTPAVTVTINQQGELLLDLDPVSLEELPALLMERTQAEPALEIHLIADERGEQDRLPLFLALFDKLAHSGLNLKLVGRPPDIEP